MPAKKKKKYYVVWVGQKPGIYENWDDCRQQIKNYPNAKYKSFENSEEAVKAFRSTADKYVGKASVKAPAKKEQPRPVKGSIAVDAACSGNPGVMEYRGVKTVSGEEIFRMGPFDWGTNNIGEFLALVHALALLKKMNREDVPIYSDSTIAIGWVHKKKARTKLKRNSKNQRLFELIKRAENWLENNKWKNPILKWPTKKWGEIPADFGRK